VELLTVLGVIAVVGMILSWTTTFFTQRTIQDSERMEVTAAGNQFLTVLKRDLAVATNVEPLSGPGGVTLSRDLGMKISLNASTGPVTVEYRVNVNQLCKTSQGKTFPCSTLSRQENPQSVPPGPAALLTVPLAQLSWCLRSPLGDSDCSSPEFLALLSSALPTGPSTQLQWIGRLQWASPVVPAPSSFGVVVLLEGSAGGSGLQRVR